MPLACSEADRRGSKAGTCGPPEAPGSTPFAIMFSAEDAARSSGDSRSASMGKGAPRGNRALGAPAVALRPLAPILGSGVEGLTARASTARRSAAPSAEFAGEGEGVLAGFHGAVQIGAADSGERLPHC